MVLKIYFKGVTIGFIWEKEWRRGMNNVEIDIYNDTNGFNSILLCSSKVLICSALGKFGYRTYRLP